MGLLTEEYTASVESDVVLCQLTTQWCKVHSYRWETIIMHPYWKMVRILREQVVGESLPWK